MLIVQYLFKELYIFVELHNYCTINRIYPYCGYVKRHMQKNAPYKLNPYGAKYLLKISV